MNLPGTKNQRTPAEVAMFLAKISQKQVAIEAGVSIGFVRDVVVGKRRSGRVEKVIGQLTGVAEARLFPPAASRARTGGSK